jgi:hypothetical protein
MTGWKYDDDDDDDNDDGGGNGICIPLCFHI